MIGQIKSRSFFKRVSGITKLLDQIALWDVDRRHQYYLNFIWLPIHQKRKLRIIFGNGC
jgi:hypothetical protein